MLAKDIYHNAVKTALVKDGWTIVADPYKIRYEDAELFADLAAEKPIAAERDGETIVVVVKSFLGASPMQDFHQALGQYILYRDLISLTEPKYYLYLAIKESTYKNLFLLSFSKAVVEENQLKLLVMNMEKEEILLWIS